MKKVLDGMDKVSTWASVACFVAMAVIMTVNIVARLFSGGLSWYMESSQYLNVWSVFLAGVGLCAANDHLRIDAIDGMFKNNEVALRWLHLIVALVTTLFFAMAAAAFYYLASKSRQEVATMPMFKMAHIYWPVPIMCGFSAVATLLRGIYDFRTPAQKEDEAC